MMSSAMAGAVARYWWVWLVRGIAAIIFGVLAWAWPGPTIFAIGILFGAYAFVDGVFALVACVRAAEQHGRWWPLLLEGIVGLVIAAITFWDIRITLLALYFTIAAWAFLTGVLEIAAGVQMRKHIANEFWLIIAGIASIIFGVLMIWFPLAGALAIVWIIGAYAILFGALMIAFAFRLRSHGATAL
jgi:uncharacterized membrane protein HdeD (DUF308 family)